MKVNLDPEGDLFYVEWGNPEKARSREVEPGIYVLYNSDGEPVAVEVLFLHRRAAFQEWLTVNVPHLAALT